MKKKLTGLIIFFLLFLIFSKFTFAQGVCGEICGSPGAGDCPSECPCQKTEAGDMRCLVPPSGDGVNLNVNLDTLLGSLPTGLLGSWQYLKIGTIISFLLRYIFVLAGLALLLMLIIGGFQLMMSAGDPKGVESGRNKVMYALIGFLIVFASFWLVQVLQVVFGLPKIF